MKQKKERKSYWGSLLLMAVLAAVTFYIFLKDNSLEDLVQVIRQANPLFIGLGLAAMLGFIACEAASVRTVLNSLGQKLSFRRCYKYAFVAFYYSSITPASSGGQPMQLYHMKKDGLNLSFGSLTILIIVFVYQIAELGFGLVMFFLKPSLIMENLHGMGILLLYGVLFNAVLLTIMLTAVFSKTLSKKLVNGAVHLLTKLKILKHPETVLESVNHQIEEYQQGAAHIRTHPVILIQVLLLTFLQLACSFIVPYFVYKAFGLNGYSVLDVLAIQSMLTLAVGSLPLPGAVGASESGFMMLYKIFFPAQMLLPAMLLSRGISFYAMLLISGVVAIAAQLLLSRQPIPKACSLSSRAAASQRDFNGLF